ncbi:MAG: 3-methyl-2-oxobutanoate dehydrogenase (2-methylpropanoyl-transferring) subunit alpha, partial [Caulobacteraceae bacterium]
MDARMNDKNVKKNSQPLSLRVPEPSGRPGDAPDFSHLQVDPAGVVERPEIGATPYEMRDLAFRLIRVLD